jgi:hypothetical protein
VGIFPLPGLKISPCATLPAKKIDPPAKTLKHGRELKLIIFHYHLRPGGVRRILELATPHLLHARRNLREIVLAAGEATDHRWNEFYGRHVAPTPVEFFLDPALGYVSEQSARPGIITPRVRAALRKLFAGATPSNTLVWAHNLGIARNLVLTRELTRLCAARGIPLLLHHHDWWFDNRWLRWPEMRRTGFATLSAAARAVFATAPAVRHLAINQADAAVLRHHFGPRAGWLPNLSECTPAPKPARRQAAHDWLQAKIADHGAPVWLLPCRLLRRKNVAEALLLTRWLRPEAWLVTTGDVSSADEADYCARLTQAARRHHWRVRLGVLAGNEARKPAIPKLLAASEAVMLTSIQEGFGLPYLEAVAARRPLIARALPNIAPDLAQFGFKFPQYYEEILVHPRLFDWHAEHRRQTRKFAAWKQQLPASCRRLAGTPLMLAAPAPQPVPFSRLTLTAQIEVLAHPTRESWTLCAALNPFLARWRERAATGRLQISAWPKTADPWLSGPAYARRFFQFTRRPAGAAPAGAAQAAQQEFIRAKLDATQLFPLLWSTQS